MFGVLKAILGKKLPTQHCESFRTHFHTLASMIIEGICNQIFCLIFTIDELHLELQVIIVRDMIFSSFPALSRLEIRFETSTLKTLSEKSYTFIEKQKTVQLKIY